MFKRFNRKLKEQQVTPNSNYHEIVHNYLKFSGANVYEILLGIIQKRSRLTYDELALILGDHYPKHPSIDKSEQKLCIILFLREIFGDYFRYDEGWVYFL